MSPVTFHGTNTERDELLAALTRNCECQASPDGVILKKCAGHTALVNDQKFVDHLEFYRWLRVQLNVEEYRS
jgi:hypothetical protein